jgi:hypothetical protein
MRWSVYSFFLFSAVSPLHAWANVVHYKGIAKNGDRTAYIEQHTVEYSDAGKLIKATTEYVSPTGKPIAELKSDFTSSLTIPSHVTKDMRTEEIQGLRREGNKVVMYFKDKDKPEESRVLSSDDEDDRILVGCQGLNYYLLGNLSSFDPEKTLPLRFLIPGKLDYYDFDMKQVGQQGDIVEFEIKVKNWFLKLFAPSLRVKYDRKQKHIVWYEGISNIKDDDGGNQKVTINYVYETEKSK